jgi:hypothetical protein
MPRMFTDVLVIAERAEPAAIALAPDRILPQLDRRHRGRIARTDADAVPPQIVRGAAARAV